MPSCCFHHPGYTLFHKHTAKGLIMPQNALGTSALPGNGCFAASCSPAKGCPEMGVLPFCTPLLVVSYSMAVIRLQVMESPEPAPVCHDFPRLAESLASVFQIFRTPKMTHLQGTAAANGNPIQRETCRRSLTEINLVMLHSDLIFCQNK